MFDVLGDRLNQDEYADMNKAVGPDPEPLSGASGSGAVPPCSYLKITPPLRANSAAQAHKPSKQNRPAACASNSFLDNYESVDDRISRIIEFEKRTGFFARHSNTILGNPGHIYKLDKYLTFRNMKTRVKL